MTQYKNLPSETKLFKKIKIFYVVKIDLLRKIIVIFIRFLLQ